MKVERQPFGEVGGREVDLFTLSSGNGLVARITNYGGILTSLRVADRDGRPGEITCGFDSLGEYFSEAYRSNSPYFGCVVGRYAGRIKDAAFGVDGVRHEVPANDGENHLHGGIDSIDKRVWEAETFEEPGKVGLRLTITSPDGDNGYPGNLEMSVTFTVTEENELSIEYGAVTDRATPLSMTHHAYFNLNGFADRILDHEAMIDADRFLVPDGSNVPVGDEFEVSGSVWDYSRPKPIGEVFAEESKGFEHYYVFRKKAGEFGKVAEFVDASSARRMEVLTSEPGMLFYTGFYTSDELRRNEGMRYGQFRGFCCETSRYPNGPNLADAPDSVLRPGDAFRSRTVFRFGTV
ncbi:aldose 1-epimerase [Haloferula helveola]|uniref:Aldose 1-epimerase n=1 Tax=Haloferula helveola TaxID=490095 RepID=A0ABM7RGI5_9BACT|nr:aldose 1-epimerase [Haloferula helveola]